MYPHEQTLIEVGRVCVAAGRLDAELGALWWHLSPDLVEELKARGATAGVVRARIRTLAAERLDQPFQDDLLAFVDEVESAQEDRNAILHSRWLLRGPDAMRPVSEWLGVPKEERDRYLREWEREAVASDGWLSQPNRSMDLVAPPHLAELETVEDRLRRATDLAVRWHFLIASMREAGEPPGWLGPPEGVPHNRSRTAPLWEGRP